MESVPTKSLAEPLQFHVCGASVEEETHSIVYTYDSKEDDMSLDAFE